MVQANP
jgi:ubiquilin